MQSRGLAAQRRAHVSECPLSVACTCLHVSTCVCVARSPPPRTLALHVSACDLCPLMLSSRLAPCAVATMCRPRVCHCPTALASRGGKGKVWASIHAAVQGHSGCSGVRESRSCWWSLIIGPGLVLDPLDRFLCSDITDHRLWVWRLEARQQTQRAGLRSPRQPQNR